MINNHRLVALPKKFTTLTTSRCQRDRQLGRLTFDITSEKSAGSSKNAIVLGIATPHYASGTTAAATCYQLTVAVSNQAEHANLFGFLCEAELGI